jgi:hypothetical protein
MQRVAGVSLDDIVIYTTTTRNVMGAGSAPLQPPQPGAFSVVGSGGGGGFGSGGFGSGGFGGSGGGDSGGGGGGIGGGGGFSSHGRLGRECKAPPDSFGVLPSLMALTLNAVHQPHIWSGLYAESQRHQTKICSHHQREKINVNAAAAQKLTPRAEDVESEEGKSIKEMLFQEKDFGQSILSL